MSKKKEIMTIVLIITVALVGIIGTTLAVFSTGSSQIGLNSFKSGCLNITIENESEAIKLSKSYPITDIEGVESTPYTFTIKNNCSTPTSYQINLESINEKTNTLNSDYVRVSLSSDTMDNLISTLSNNTSVSPSIDNAYAAYNLYTGSLEGNSSKTYELKEWIEYNATIEQAANKVYESRISVVANPDLEFSTNYEVKTTLAENELQGILSVTEFLKNKKILYKNIRNIETEDTSSTTPDEPNQVYKNIINIVNDETYPFNYDSETGRFTSTNKVDSTTSTITFFLGDNINQAGICYEASSERKYDEAIFYLDNVEIGRASGEKSNCINIGDITPDNQIKVEYSKDSSESSGNDEISFYLSNEYTIVKEETEKLYPFDYNSNTGKFTSTNKDDSSKSWVTFSAGSEIKDAGICYTVSSEEGYDEAIFYLDGVEVGTASGEDSNCINIGDITSSNQIKAEYSKDGSDASGNDEISFYLVENAPSSIPADSSVKYCLTTDNICIPNANAPVSNNTVNIAVSNETITTVLGSIEVNKKVKEMICSQIESGKVYCSNLIEKGCGDTFSSMATTDEGICETEDDWGTSYYYRGAVKNNWVSFAGYYWRIIRINGDGSIRIIYNGTTTEQTGNSTLTNGGYDYYNTSHSDNAYIGYMYGQAGSSTYAATHANISNSTIKTVVDNWYKTNILDKNYDSYISKEAGFCNDRSIAAKVIDGYGMLGYGTNKTLYGINDRILYNDGKYSLEPTMKCPQIINDLFTTSNSTKGNKKLTYPVGLITMDEVIYAGAKANNVNQSYYLYSNQSYWTMTPNYYQSSAEVYFVQASGGTQSHTVTQPYKGTRPVINLASNVKLTGSGTASDPYKVLE